jgi:hypothetical protein
MMSRITDAIQAVDARLIAKFQKAADWAYTLWGVSPYWIAAQIFGFTALLHIITTANKLTTGSDSLGHAFTLAVMGLLVSVYWFYCAIRSDTLWKSGRPPEAWMVFLLGFWRVTSVLFLSVGLCFIVLMLISEKVSFSSILIGARDIAEFAGFYLLSCSAPTKIHRRQRELVPLPTTS